MPVAPEDDREDGDDESHNESQPAQNSNCTKE